MPVSVAISPETLVETQLWRYATKKFDASRTIPEGTWAALEQSLVLSPSSFGLQPWKFVVVTDPAVKAKLKAASWNQGQIEECSHLVVFLAKDAVTEADVDRFLARTAEVRQQGLETLAPYRDMMLGFVVNGPLAPIQPQWTALQTYIALGNFMTSAALLGVDTCPMEGIDPAQYDQILGVAGTGYRTVVACPAGYRSAEDATAQRAKVRFPSEAVVARV